MFNFALQGDLCGLVKILKTPVVALIPKVILYVQTKDMAWKLYSYLLGESVPRSTIEVYHASLTHETKCRVYREFKNHSSCRKCLIATVAFGMVCYFIDLSKYFLLFYIRVWIFPTLK